MCDKGIMVVCRSCGEGVPGDEFSAGMHDCPMGDLTPMDGESFPDYKRRSDKHKRGILLGMLPPEGARVEFTEDIERYPWCIVPTGTTGTVEETGDLFVHIRLDQTIEGMEDWGNALHLCDADLIDNHELNSLRVIAGEEKGSD
jgi:hypothetical protein